MKICFSIGELSADEHAAHVATALYKMDPKVEIIGMGGSNLRAAGCNTIVDSEVYASVMGFAEVIKSLPKIRYAFNKLKKLLKEWKPDVLFLVDYPDFNLRLAKQAKKLGIPVVYFVPPTVWAWRKKRINLLKKYVNACAVIYPFEQEFYLNNGYDKAFYVGHPFSTQSDQFQISPEEKQALFDELGLDINKKTLLLFPGSRKQEVQRLLNPLIEAVALLNEKHPDLQTIISKTPSLDQDLFQDWLPENNSPIVFSSHDSLKLLRNCDAGIIKSGTSNLQAAFCKLPFAMIYKASALASFIVRKIVKIKEYSMVNIIQPGSIKEFIQEDCTPDAIAKEAEQLLFDDSYQRSCLDKLKSVTSKLDTIEPLSIWENCQTPAERVAKLVHEIKKNKPHN